MSRTLYKRLGELKGITKLVDVVVNIHMANPSVSPRFLPLKEQPERLAVIKEHTVNFFVREQAALRNIKVEIWFQPTKE